MKRYVSLLKSTEAHSIKINLYIQFSPLHQFYLSFKKKKQWRTRRREYATLVPEIGFKMVAGNSPLHYMLLQGRCQTRRLRTIIGLLWLQLISLSLCERVSLPQALIYIFNFLLRAK